MSPRDGAPTRAAVLAAASALLGSGGPGAVTMRSVGTRAGVSYTAPYRHFEDKSHLLQALVLQTLTELGTRIRRALSDHGDDPATCLQQGCLAYLRYALAHPHHYQLVFGDTPIAQPPPEIEAAADAGMLALRDLVLHAQTQGQLKTGPPRELATILWALLHGMVHLQMAGHLHEPRTIDGAEHLEDLLAAALAALRPPPGARDA